MDNKDEFKAVYPPEFQQLEEPLAKLKSQIRTIDGHIKNLPPDKGPQLILRPDFDQYRPPGREERIAGFERQKLALKNEHYNLVETELAGVAPDKAAAVRNITRQQLRDEKQEIEKSPADGKENTLKEKFAFNRAEVLHVEEKQVLQPEAELLGQHTDIDEWSNRFLNLLQDSTGPGSAYDDLEPDKDDW